MCNDGRQLEFFAWGKGALSAGNRAKIYQTPVPSAGATGQAGQAGRDKSVWFVWLKAYG